MLVGAEGEDDERDLEALEENAFERDRERVPVERAPVAGGGARSFGLLRKGRGFVVQRLQASRAKDRFAQPLKPEDEQQAAHRDPQHVDR